MILLARVCFAWMICDIMASLLSSVYCSVISVRTMDLTHWA